MKKKSTEEILAESFQEIAAVKKANKITVSDIVRNCGMSPATFYRHFKDKYDLIAWIYGQKCQEIFTQFNGSVNSRKETAHMWVNFCEENKTFLLNLIQNTKGYDSFLRNMVREHVRIIENSINFAAGEDALTEKIRMKAYLHSSGAVRLMYAWLMGKISASKDELAESIDETLPTSIVRLITPPKE